jgi:hypothetical protein
MGWPTLQEEKDALIVTLRARKQDHLNWLAKLLDCVTKGAEVTVETDPHKCAFGRWYDTFTTTSASLGSYLKRFDDPHKTIHTIAVRAGELMARGEVEAAKALIHRSEGAELETLVSLFDGVEDVLGHHFSEYSVIVHQEAADAGSAPDDGPEMKADAAIAADRVEHFGTVDRIIQPAPFPPGTPGSELYLAIAVREREGTAEQSPVVDVERFLTGAAA